MSKVAAIVVGYKPEIDIIDNLLSSLVSQVDLLILVDNGCSGNYLSQNLEEKQKIKYIDLGENLGLGRALNVGFKHAVQYGAEFVVTFDQDSRAVPTLIADLRTAMENAKSKDPQCIAVSPTFFDRRDGKKRFFPFYQSINGVIKPVFESQDDHGLVAADALITSGMFVDARAWNEGITYDEGMFVDFTDTEWCFRVRDHGYNLYGCLNVEMGHALSDAPPVKIFGLSFFRYSPIRRYFFFRNTVAVCRMEHTPAIWKRRLCSALMLRFIVNLVIDKDKMLSLKMMVRGIYHGLRKSLGPFH